MESSIELSFGAFGVEVLVFAVTIAWTLFARSSAGVRRGSVVGTTVTLVAAALSIVLPLQSLLSDPSHIVNWAPCRYSYLLEHL